MSPPDSDSRSLRILVITRNLPPLIGGMERLVQNLCIGISEWAEVTVIGPRGCRDFLPAQINTLEAPQGMGPYLARASFLALNALRTQDYDLVIGGSGLVAPLVRITSRLAGARSAALIHGLDIVVNNPIYQSLFIPSIRRLDILIANSRNTKALAIARDICSDKIKIVNPGTNLPDMPERAELEQFRENHGFPQGHIVLFVGRLTRRKGLSGFIRHCFPSILEQVPETILLVVGENPNDSLNKAGEEAQVLAAADMPQVKEQIRFLGHVSEDELRICYGLADVQVLPSVEEPGDVEGFGMIAVEAAACGTPTVAFDLGGVGDAISELNGALIEKNDYTRFAAEVSRTLTAKTPGPQSCRSHASHYAWPKYHAKMHKVLLESGQA